MEVVDQTSVVHGKKGTYTTGDGCVQQDLSSSGNEMSLLDAGDDLADVDGGHQFVLVQSNHLDTTYLVGSSIQEARVPEHIISSGIGNIIINLRVIIIKY